jgi:hypothetical protein
MSQDEAPISWRQRWDNFKWWYLRPAGLKYSTLRGLKRLGVRLYPIEIGGRWFKDSGMEIKFYGVHLRRLGIAFTWRVK